MGIPCGQDQSGLLLGPPASTAIPISEPVGQRTSTWDELKPRYRAWGGEGSTEKCMYVPFSAGEYGLPFHTRREGCARGSIGGSARLACSLLCSSPVY